ncbi:MAG: hypothetical protein LQ351_004999 [Letrouitia transgressa]|nr:MAG: hypothetical protein LQ351_004999 [Letrouitia transgressa]
MAKLRPERRAQGERGKQKHGSSILHQTQPPRKSNSGNQRKVESPSNLLAQVLALLQTAQPEEALSTALKALKLLKDEYGDASLKLLPALTLSAEVAVELGEAEKARDYFLQAATLDPDGTVDEASGGSAEKFLWLAQLCEQGGHESVNWFEKGIKTLRREIAEAQDEEVRREKRRKLASALCGVVEIYMTDLSWEEDAETRCERLVTEALMLAPEEPQALQTLASVRISQQKMEEARKALKESIELWKELPAGDERVPEFPVRISLARLLMEVEMEEEGIEVLERLVEEEDGSVEAWYLGGWCLWLIVEKKRQRAEAGDEEDLKVIMVSSREWLQNSLRLFELQDYEDSRLREHALELVKGLNVELRDISAEEDEEGDGDEVWESESGSEGGDAEMKGI